MEERVPRPIKAYIIVDNPIEKPKTKMFSARDNKFGPLNS